MVRHAISILIPAFIWIPFGLALLLDPKFAVAGPLLGFAVRSDVDFSPIALFMGRFAGTYVTYIGVLGFLAYFGGSFEIRKFWLFGQLVFCVLAALFCNVALFKHDEATIELYSGPFKFIIEHSYPVLNPFGIIFTPLSLWGFLAPPPPASSLVKPLLGS